MPPCKPWRCANEREPWHAPSDVVLYSGGVSSWEVARIFKSEGRRPHLLFTDTLMEDADLYRFAIEGAKALDLPLVRILDGRDLWRLFFDQRFIGNTRVDICARILKRDLAARWLKDCAPDATVGVGYDWTERNRFERALAHYPAGRLRAPLIELETTRESIFEHLAVAGVAPPALTAAGFPHNNCGGFCVKGGQAHFARLLAYDRARYLYHEGMEQEFRVTFGKDVSILRDRRGGKTRPLTMRELRRRIECGEGYESDDWGACGCT